MSNAETKSPDQTKTKPTGPAESKPIGKVESKSADKTEVKPGSKAESSQAGKGSKRRPTNAKQFAANYAAIHWGKKQSPRPKP